LVLRENDIIDLPRQLGACNKLKELHIQAKEEHLFGNNFLFFRVIVFK